MSTQTTTKQEWPEFLHQDGDKAVAGIKKDRPELTVVKVNDGDMVTMDFREDRVRVWVDEKHHVSKVPRLG